ncbi:MAG: EF-hand domain-containing protein [Saonia sp.]
MKKSKMMAVITCMAATNTFFAQEKKGERPSPEEVFERLDASEDGLLEKEELAKARNSEKLLKNFDTIDTDKDGMLSLEEFKAIRKSRARKKE